MPADPQAIRRLCEAFSRGYPSSPPLRLAVLTGAACGAVPSERDWGLLLRGEGCPWRTFNCTDPENEAEAYPSWRCCWFSDCPDVGLTGALRRFRQLADEAWRLEDSGETSHSPPMAEIWGARLHTAVWGVTDPILKAERWKFLRGGKGWPPDTMVRVRWAREMDDDHSITSVCDRVVNGTLREPGASPALQHRFLSVLVPDVYQAAAALLDLRSRRLETIEGLPQRERECVEFLKERYPNCYKASAMETASVHSAVTVRTVLQPHGRPQRLGLVRTTPAGYQYIPL